MWCESIQEKLQSCVCRHYEEKVKNKNKIAIGPESVDDEADPSKEDMTKRKIPALVMWYLLVIDDLKCVFSNPRDVELVCWHSEKHMKNDEEIRYRFGALSFSTVLSKCLFICGTYVFSLRTIGVL
jgi:hypothetical protein